MVPIQQTMKPLTSPAGPPFVKPKMKLLVPSVSQSHSGVNGTHKGKAYEKRPSHVAISVHVKPTIEKEPKFRYQWLSAPKTMATADAPSAVAASQTRPGRPRPDGLHLRPLEGLRAVIPWPRRSPLHTLYCGL